MHARIPCLRSEVWLIETVVGDDPQAMLGPLGYGLATVTAAASLILDLDPPQSPERWPTDAAEGSPAAAADHVAATPTAATVMRGRIHMGAEF